MKSANMNVSCPHCGARAHRANAGGRITEPAAYCCEAAELSALRKVVDEVQRVLAAEVDGGAPTIGGSDSTDVVSLASAKLKAARRPSAGFASAVA